MTWAIPTADNLNQLLRHYDRATVKGTPESNILVGRNGRHDNGDICIAISPSLRGKGIHTAQIAGMLNGKVCAYHQRHYYITTEELTWIKLQYIVVDRH